MFPFRVFVEHEIEVAQKNLTIFIQYVFLGNS
jgi:hypothetical protein